ncbi:MAG TPA: lipoyl synthase [bacterium]|nr:lipoyl synthase [bacterium]
MNRREKTASTRLPPWLKKRGTLSGNLHSMKSSLRAHGLHTVCEEARCPNIDECFGRGTATIMIMGDRCTRNCGFCSVSHGRPAPLDPDEPGRVAGQISGLGLKHAVVTSVTRDDLPDGGADHFAKTIRAIGGLCPETAVEVLVPDFMGREEDIKTVCDAFPSVFNHNVETVERLTGSVRSNASYRRSLGVLSAARGMLKGPTKSGIMVGLGESDEEVERTIEDLAQTGVGIVTIGQYLRPSKLSLDVARYVKPETFREYEKIGLKLGIKHMFCGPLVRSSYMADKVLL